MKSQALVTASVYGTPQRTVSGFDLRRLQLLLAVLEKRGGFHFGVKDVFLNIAGGLKVEDPSIDLAVLCALLSSFEDIPLAADTCFAGEVGLNGEIRAVNRIGQRIAEAEKLGFSKILISKYNQKGLKNFSHQIEIKWMGKVEEVYKYLILKARDWCVPIMQIRFQFLRVRCFNFFFRIPVADVILIYLQRIFYFVCIARLSCR